MIKIKGMIRIYTNHAFDLIWGNILNLTPTITFLYGIICKRNLRRNFMIIQDAIFKRKSIRKYKMDGLNEETIIKVQEMLKNIK